MRMDILTSVDVEVFRRGAERRSTWEIDRSATRLAVFKIRAGLPRISLRILERRPEKPNQVRWMVVKPSELLGHRVDAMGRTVLEVRNLDGAPDEWLLDITHKELCAVFHLAGRDDLVREVPT